MLRTRLIPVLQLRRGALVKTSRFGKFTYVGDPANTCRIFNECEVDELAVVDITATRDGHEPDFEKLTELAEECFMPLAYGGGITTVQQAEKILRLGMEKVIVGSAAHANPGLLTQIASAFGSQCLVAAIDVKRGLIGGQRCYSRSGTRRTAHDPVIWAKQVEDLGAGEILLTSIDREGTWQGFDLALVSEVSNAVSIPVIAHGGAASLSDAREAVDQGASAVAFGSMVVFQKQDMGVLVNFPEEAEQKRWGFG